MNRCKVCKECCCALVNDVINILIEYGEIDPEVEVNIMCLLLSFSVIIVVFCSEL